MTNYRDVWYHSSDGLRLYARDYPCRRDAPTLNEPASRAAIDQFLCQL